MSPPIRDGSGSSIGSIRLGDGSEISEVRTGAGDVLFSATAPPPGSAVAQHFATEQSESNGQTVAPFTDSLNTNDLSAVGAPKFDSNGLNSGPSVRTDGSDDGYNYSTPDLTEPATIIWAADFDSTNTTGTLWREDSSNRILNQQGINDLTLVFNGNNSGTQATAISGQNIVTLAVDATEAIVRVNGTEVISVGSASNTTVLADGNFWYSSTDGRHVPADVGGSVIHNQRLSGSSLTDEEKRVEQEFGMSVL